MTFSANYVTITLKEIKGRFDTKMDPRELGTPELAYLGDSVFELLVRQKLIQNGFRGAGALNAAAKQYVTAAAQAEAADRILPLLSAEEEAVLRRARNHKTKSVPKSASTAQYHLATGIEALFAYLYLKNETNRMSELFETAFGGNSAPAGK